MLKNAKVLRVFRILIIIRKVEARVGFIACVLTHFDDITDRKIISIGRKIYAVTIIVKFCYGLSGVYSIFIIAQILQILPRDIGYEIIWLPISPEVFGEFWSIIKMNFIDYFLFFYFFFNF